MGMIAERMAEIADYCRVDPDDPQFPSCVAVAVGYLAGAGVLEPAAEATGAELYVQCVKFLALDLIDRRDMTIDGSVTANPAFQGIKNQLKMMSVPNSGTDNEGGS